MTTKFYRDVEHAVASFGGFHNAHLHLDRANTLDDGFVDHGKLAVLESSHISLQKKHALIATVHEGKAYESEIMQQRVDEAVDVMVSANTRIADTMVDVTDDCLQTSALDFMMNYADTRRNQIKIRCAAYTPVGFSDAHPGRWRLFEEGVAKADFIGSLPEADDVDDYPENIGFEEHCRRMLDLVRRTGKFVHVHTDQLNYQNEHGTERLIEIMRAEGMSPVDEKGEPLVWAVHMVSPSRYDEKRWDAFVEGMLECNIGLITCPSAAIAMRQFRCIEGPTYNSIPRVLDLAARGVRIRMGSDNVADMCSPNVTANLMDEVFMLSSAERYFQPDILAKFACGIELGTQERETLTEHLKQNDIQVQKRI